MRKKLEQVVIVGGGTAGWTVAHRLLNKLDPGIGLTVVADRTIPTIGVGESTTRTFYDLMTRSPRSNFSEDEFLRETNSTFKLGTLHRDWVRGDDVFVSPLGGRHRPPRDHPSEDYDYIRIFKVAKNRPMTHTPEAKLLLNSCSPYFDVPEENRYPAHFESGRNHLSRGYAYHLDSHLVAEYLRTKAIDAGVKHVEGRVVGSQHSSSGDIVGLTLASGALVGGDLFIDCSGFRRTLIGTMGDPGRCSYSDELPTNRALTFQLQPEPGSRIASHTEAQAMRNGWMWKIPTQGRVGCGYVFSDLFASVDEARQEIEQSLGHSIEPQLDIKFEAGRLEKFWIRNCVAIGLSSAFVEPLEATSIHATILQTDMLLSEFLTPAFDFDAQPIIDSYNTQVAKMWDNIRDFIVLHYRSQRSDTEFWRQVSAPTFYSPALRERLELWMHRMPRSVDYHNIFFYRIENLWYQILHGMEVLDPELARAELNGYGLWKVATDHEQQIEEFGDYVLEHAIDHATYLERLHQ